MTRSVSRLTHRSALALAAALCLGSGLAGAANARPLTPAENRYEPFDGQVPQCDDPAVLEKLKARFSSKEATYWGEDIHILGFDRIRQTGLRSWGMDHIPRRYCTAVAITDEVPPKAPLYGKRILPSRRVVYNIVEDGGFAGYGFGVEFCVQHHDHNAAFAPACKAAGP
jgi:hypothetical protein